MDLFKELDEATKQHASAERVEIDARSELAEAVNRLNRAQKAIDQAMVATKAKAPWNTDWHSQRHPGLPVTTYTDTSGEENGTR